MIIDVAMRTGLTRSSSIRADAKFAGLLASVIWLAVFAALMTLAFTGHYPHPIEAAARRLGMAVTGVLLFCTIDLLLDRTATLPTVQRFGTTLACVAGGSICWSLVAFAIAHLNLGSDAQANPGLGVFRELALNTLAVAGLFASWVTLCIALGYRRKLREHTQSQRTEAHLWIQMGGKRVRLLLNDVEYLQADHDYVHVHSRFRRYLVHRTLQTFFVELTGAGFLRTHRSFLVNIRHVSEVRQRPGGLLELALISGAVVPVGRTHSNEVRDRLNYGIPLA